MGTAILVENRIAATQHLTAQAGCEHTLVEIHAQEIGSKSNIFIMSVYCRPSQKQYEFDRVVLDAKRLARTRPLLILGDFNAPHTLWGYRFQSKRGKALVKTMEALDITLLNEPGVPTRRGNSASRDTTPDLSWLSGSLDVTWKCEDEDLGSDHRVITLTVRGPDFRAKLGTAHITDWDKMRTCTQAEDDAEETTSSHLSYKEWADKQKRILDQFTRKIATTTKVPFVDSRLAHMWAARHSLTKRWKRQRRNKKLARRIAKLNADISEHVSKLSRENWLQICDGLQGQLSVGKTWKLLRHLIDPAGSKTASHRSLTKVLNTYDGDGDRLIKALKEHYLQTERGQHPAPQEYTGPHNEDLDRPFSLSELWSAIDDSNKKSAPGKDAITYRLLTNMSSRAAQSLLEHINRAWESSQLPPEWTEAEVRFIPKPGKAPAIENMRPISLTSCVGKVMERMVLRRLQVHLENTDQLPKTMFGFRKQLSTQDVMLQLHELVIKQATRNSPRAILALDLKGAFDNVTHASILTNLNGTRCGTRTFGYIKNFLSSRTAQISVGNERSEPIELGERGTPQGAVLSPLLFNLALLPLPRLLDQIEGIGHALYADDITIWTKQAGSDGWIEETLQAAALTVHEYARTCGLSCAPQKSELLVVQPGKPRQQLPPDIAIQIEGIKITPTDKCRILGLTLQDNGKAHAAVDKIKNSAEKILAMLRRVTTRNRGLKEDDALRLVQAFIISRITYSAPYLNLNKTQKTTLDTIIRKATKQALGLPIYSSTQRLQAMGVHNTVDELIEAHLSSQRLRLSQTIPGRAVLDKIGWRKEQATIKTTIPTEWTRTLKTKPLPRNMAPGKDDGRRQARAKAVSQQLQQENGVLYVDASLVKGSNRAAVVVTDAERLINSAAVKTKEPTTAEEVAIALALVQPGVGVVVTDSKRAYSGFRKGVISSEAATILSKKRAPGRAIELTWVPAHTKVAGNVIADYHARAMTLRAGQDTDTPTPALTYKEITNEYKDERRTLPEPHRTLSREQQTILRRIQAGSLAHPVLLHTFYPEHEGDRCPFCKTNSGTLAHILAECTKLKAPIPPNPPSTPPTPLHERWETLRSSPALPTQLALTARGQELLAQYGSRDLGTAPSGV
ncbi:hypothetical protein HPB48_017614 [Haemaphysalis longicornis]|uniref:Reverse transcriptase domain-containing protein n=1 Tax=Haemaphysalis longicornis TaxID=44386 RepID=A0A9J6H119_HAELO|nr:hypothetical protein HPB48_017614 [Haemaphysalis longicornis]